MESRFKMSLVELFSIGVLLVFYSTILISFDSDSSLQVIFLAVLLMISAFLVAILADTFFLSSSSAAPPACLDGFIIETNGGTGGANTCTPLDP